MRIPRISKARQAIFDKHKCPADEAKKHHRLIETEFEKAVRIYKEHLDPMPDTHDGIGNAILEAYFAIVDKSEKSIVARRLAYLANVDKFFEIFRQPLSKYWSAYLGFDVLNFDKFIQPKDDETTYQAIGSRYGQAAVEMIQSLLV